MLPQNMATILTLAALQDQETKAGGSAPPHHGAPSTPPASGLVVMDPTKGGELRYWTSSTLFATLKWHYFNCNSLVIIDGLWYFGTLSVVVVKVTGSILLPLIQLMAPVCRCICVLDQNELSENWGARVDVGRVRLGLRVIIWWIFCGTDVKLCLDTCILSRVRKGKVFGVQSKFRPDTNFVSKYVTKILQRMV